MKKIILIGFIVISMLVLIGCEGVDVSELSDEDLERISGKAVICNKPYIRIGMECCLDQNDNNICDNDEKPKKEEVKEEKPKCSDECSTDTCSGFDYIACLQKSDGCKDKENKGKVKGKCSVECLTNNDCDSKGQCESYKCEYCEDECTLDSCDGKEYIACLKQSDGCKDKFNKGETIGKCSIECLDDSDCSDGKECSYYECKEKSDLTKSLNDLKDKLSDYQEMTSKLDECTKLCAGDDYNIPVIRDSFYTYCYEMYYNLGMDGLDEAIEGCK